MRYASMLLGGVLILVSAACRTTAPLETSTVVTAANVERPIVVPPMPMPLTPMLVHGIETEDDFKQWFTYYYMQPSPDLVSDAVMFMASHNYMLQHPDLVSSFLGHVFSTHSDHLKDWLKGWEKLDRRSWSVILVSLWFSGNDRAQTLMKIYLDRAETVRLKDLKALMDTNSKPDLLALDVRDPRQINLLWAAFSASGDERIVEKVISYMEHYQPEAHSANAQIAEAAVLSLATNALQHELVAKVCLIQHQTNPSPKIRILLEAMLTALSRVNNRTLSH